MILQSFPAALFLFFICWIDETTAHTIQRSPKAFSSTSLVRRAKSKSAGRLDFAAERKGLLEKYRNKQSLRSHAPRQSTIQVDTVNQNMDIMYYATVNVGTPPQSYAVILGKYLVQI
jgi:hypothetical protein